MDSLAVMALSKYRSEKYFSEDLPDGHGKFSLFFHFHSKAGTAIVQLILIH